MGVRVQWVAWRTLRCRVEEGGSLDGRPLYRVHDLQMVLGSDGRSFRRVLACGGCGRLRATHRRVTAADLQWDDSVELCADCVPSTTRPMDLGDVDRVLADEDGDQAPISEAIRDRQED